MIRINEIEENGIHLTGVSGRAPIQLSDPNELCFVENGSIDLFLVGWKNGDLVGGWNSLMRVNGPAMLTGIDIASVSSEWMLIGVMTPESNIVRFSRDALLASGYFTEHQASIVKLLDEWISNFTAVVKHGVPPKTSIEVSIGQTAELKPNECLTIRDGIQWMAHQTGASLFYGREDYGRIEGDLPFPITNTTWLVSTGQAIVKSLSTTDCIEAGQFWRGIDRFNRLCLQAAIANQMDSFRLENQRISARENIDDGVMRDAVERLASILNKDLRHPRATADASPLLASCQLIGQAQGIDILPPPENSFGRKVRDPIDAIAKASRVNRRMVALRGRWWAHDNGPMLAFTVDKPRPVALIPISATRYNLHDPANQDIKLVTDDVAAGLQPFAYTFYRPFARTVLSLIDIMKLGSFGSFPDFSMLIVMGLAGGLLGMVTPIATGMLFDTVIPSADKNQLFQLTMGLIAIAFASTLFQFTRSVALLRVEGKMDSLVQAGIWDRLLTLPVPFFRNYTAGDLAMRANGINAIRQTLSGTTVSSIMGSVFSLFSFALLFYYSFRLAIVATVAVLLVLLVTVITSLIKLKYERRLAEVHGRLSGMVLQFLSGIAKLKVTGSERRAFSVWAKEFGYMRSLTFKAQNIGNVLGTFNSVFPVLASMAIFITVVFFNKGHKLTTGDFIAFNAAFGSFLSAMLSMTGAMISILRIVPLYERAKPILQTVPEVDEAKEDPGELFGEIEVNHVCFSYDKDTAPVINDVSMHIKPGQFIAFVGASGSGKSTMLRLLLGFETPDSGTIYYDGKDMAGVDLIGIRRQLGVVLQNGQLLQGDIFSNIVGASKSTMDDAWEAARLSGLDQDIEALPMGMHTIVAEGGGGLSGGQRQRLLIARAIVHKPRILFFDEATSALDNATQAIVSQSLDRLEATRVVIAHRLSTIVNADYIYVMDKGRVVQEGAYRDLIDQPGLFAELAKRQIA